MADWTLLPNDLLDQISTRLPSSVDTLRFRSVCTSWRSSLSPPPPPLLSIHIPVSPQISTLRDPTFFHLSTRLIYLLSSPNHPHPWITKSQLTPQSHHLLLNPLSESPIHPLHFHSLNLTNIQILELGQEHVLRYNDKSPFRHADVYSEKVVSTPFAVFTIHVSGRLALYRMQENVWSVIDEMSSPYDDVIRYNGSFYAVDGIGRAVVVCEDLTVKEIASPVFGGDKKYLVEMDGELMLVDRYLTAGAIDVVGDGIGDVDFGNFSNHDYEVYVPNDDNYVMDATMRFKVFKLDWYVNEWIEVNNLGDGVLFLGDNCAFSASVLGGKANCIYFTDKFFQAVCQSSRVEEGPFKHHHIGVFNMEDGKIGPLSSYMGYLDIFWPPPAWVTSEGS